MKESSDGETLIAVDICFQICGAAEEKGQRPKSVFIMGTNEVSIRCQKTPEVAELPGSKSKMREMNPFVSLPPFSSFLPPLLKTIA